MEYGPNPNKQIGDLPVISWGHPRLPKQKGIVTYNLCSNRQRPLAGALHNAIFNTARRTWGQIFYWGPPMVAAYLIMDWGEKRSKYLNSKEGRLAEGVVE